MQKYFYTLFLVSASLFGMEQEVERDPALTPTYQECKDIISPHKNCFGMSSKRSYDKHDKALLKEYARYGGVSAFNKREWGLDWDRNKLLQWAVEQGETETVAILISRNITKSIDENSWRELIFTALHEWHEQIAISLLKAWPDIDVNKQSWQDDTLLHRAVSRGGVQFTKELLEGDYKVDVNATLGGIYVPKTPLQMVAESDGKCSLGRDSWMYISNWHKIQNELLQLLVEHGADPTLELTFTIPGRRPIFDSDTAYKKSFISWCMEKKKYDCLTALVEKNYILSREKYKVDMSEYSFILWAARSGHAPLMQALVATGSDVNVRDNSQFGNVATALSSAVHFDNKEMVDVLLKQENINLHLIGNLPQFVASWAIEHGHVDCLELVVQKCGLKLFDREWFVKESAQCKGSWLKKEPALCRAAKAGHLPVVRKLIEYGLDVNAKKKNGQTPLGVAVSNGHTEVCRVLLENAPQKKSRPSLVINAIKKGASEIADLLLAYDENSTETLKCADKKLVKQSGETVLEYVCSRKNPVELCRVLLQHGADANAKNKKGQPPLFAALPKNTTITQMLLKNGADIHAVDDEGNTVLHVAASSGKIEQLKGFFA